MKTHPFSEGSLHTSVVWIYSHYRHMSLTLSSFDISRVVPVYEVIRIRSLMKAEKAKVCRNKRKRPLVDEALISL